MNSKPLEGIHPTAKCAPQCPFRTSDVGHLTRDEFGAHGWRAVFEPKLMPRVPKMILADLRDDTSKAVVGNWLASMPNWRQPTNSGELSNAVWVDSSSNDHFRMD